MSYEVIKKVGGRSYRYVVDSVRDPVSGLRKSRWRYLGRVEAHPARHPEDRAKETRDRFLKAFLGLLQSRRFKALTVKAVARRAQMTHATFYRHFRSMHDLLGSAIALAQQALPSLDLHVTGDASEERRKISRLLEGVFEQARRRTGLLKAFIETRGDSSVLQALWEAHNRKLEHVWTVYIGELNRAGIGRNDAAESLARAVVLCIQARLHDAIVQGRPLSKRDSELWASIVSRMIIKG